MVVEDAQAAGIAEVEPLRFPDTCAARDDVCARRNLRATERGLQLRILLVGILEHEYPLVAARIWSKSRLRRHLHHLGPRVVGRVRVESRTCRP